MKILRFFRYNRVMTNLKRFVMKNRLWLLASFGLPLLLIALILGFNGIHWNSSRSILAGDSYHQYVALHALYRNILHSGGSQGFFYTFTSGLGMNLYAFSAYYMGSFFMPLTYFFNVHNMPDCLYLLTLLKIGTIGLTTFISLKNMYQKLSNWLVLALATAFPLMSFITSQIEIVMWLDVFILLPLIMWGLHSLQDFGRKKLYFITLTILFIQNYYFGFMIAIFLVLYFLARTTFGKWSWRALLDFVVTSICSGITSLIMILPMYLDLKANNTDAFSQILRTFTENSKPLDIFAKNFVGIYDTTQYNAVPMIYVGLAPLILAVLFFFLKNVKIRTKLAFLAIFGVLIASFYLQILDLFWQGMHSPNMFLHRYAFLFSLLVIFLACETLSRFEEDFMKTWRILLVVLLLSLGFIITAGTGDYENYLKSANFALTFLFLLAYGILLVTGLKEWLPKRLLLIVFALFISLEAGVNGYYQVAGIQKEWNFASRDYYNQQVKLIDPIAKAVQSKSKTSFARLENTSPDTGNDGMKFDYNSLSQFSSVRNSNSSSTMRQLGFHTDDTYLNLRYPENTLLMDSIFAVKYNLNQNQPVKYGFHSVSADKNLSALTENQYAQTLGIFVPGGYQNVKFVSSTVSNSALTNQTRFVNELSKSNQTYFTQFYTTSESTDDTITGSGDSVTLNRKSTSDGDVSVTYGITAPAGKQIYLSVPNINYISQNSKSMVVTISDVSNPKVTKPVASYSVATDDSSSYFNLGYYPQATQLKVSLSFPDNSQVSFDTTSFWALDTTKYQTLAKTLKAKAVTAKTVKNGATFTVNAQKSGDLFLTIPYDKGWSATLDGKKVPVKQAQTGFMKVTIPKSKHHLTLHFVPAGFKIGLICFVAGIVLFVLYDRYRARPPRVRSKHEKTRPK